MTWGTDASKPVPTVDHAVVKLADSECQGQGVSLIALKPDGSEMARFQSTRVEPTLGPRRTSRCPATAWTKATRPAT